MNNKESNFEDAISLAKFLTRRKGNTPESVEQAIFETKKIHSYLLDKDMVKIKRIIETDMNIFYEEPKILTKRESRKSWLYNKKAQIEFVFWERYRSYLVEDMGFTEKAINNIDNITDKIIDSLFDPDSDYEYNKKGLVMGHVQSGKTANYIGLINKAIDAGFNFIIILAGIHNNLRSQTQLRVDLGVIGRDSQMERNTKKMIGVSKFSNNSAKPVTTFTTSDEGGDFSATIAKQLGVDINTNDILIGVIKKNASVLKNLNKWVSHRVKNGKLNNKKLLLIDDEADNASLNTNKEELNPTTINNHIRTLLSFFTKKGYVGYTATPFANLFVNQDDEDLFPKDFIVNLSAGSDYFGPNKLFNNEENDSSLPLVINVNDYLTFVPKKHKKDDIKPDFIPESLRDAILMFIITIAIRNIRGHGNKHNSMLIHVTRFTTWQTHIRGLIEEEFEAIKNKIKVKITNSIYKEIKYLYYGKEDKYPSYNNITAEVDADKDLNDPFIKQHNWEEIEPLLKNVVETIQIKEIHGKSNDALSYYDEPNGINAILIGGNKLSRGLTIEGLSISYFLRTSEMYDTLMQMGRWFGYRKGYADLCRIFTTSELEEYYKHITLASIELREDFDDMNRNEQAPEDFLLKVRTHPESLRITAANKMRNSTKISISWSGKLFETYKLSKNSDSIEQNYKLLDNLLLKIDKYDRTNSNNRFLKNNYLYSNIDNDLLYEFINKFSMEKEFSVIKYEPLKYYISEMFQRNIYKKWNLVIINKNNASIHDTYKFGSISVGAVTRTEESLEINKEKPKFSEYFSIRKSHIISPEHETLDLSEEKTEKALKETKNKFKEKYSDKYGNKIENEIEKIKIPNGKIIKDNYRKKDTPLIIIYIIDKKSHLSELENYDYPLIGFAISFPKSEDFKSTEYAIPESLIKNIIEYDKDFSLQGEDEDED